MKDQTNSSVRLFAFIKRHALDGLVLGIVCVWALPMLLSRSRIEYGDFGYFAQVYEAIKLSILGYHQFPWWNPWIAGGIPLYANPQAGVFSITTLFALIFTT